MNSQCLLRSLRHPVTALPAAFFLGFLGLLLLGSLPVAAQETPAPDPADPPAEQNPPPDPESRSPQDTAAVQWATVTGRVVSAITAEPVGGAVVTLRRSQFGAITDSTGRFTIEQAAPGQDTVEVSYTGYQTNATPLFIEPDMVTRVVFLLSPTVIRVAELVVEVRRRTPGPVRELERRQRRGIGHFISLEEIEEQAPRYSSDLLRGVPGIQVGPNHFGRASVTMSRTDKVCPPDIVLDGTWVRGMEIDEIRPGDLEALEIYRGPSEVPSEYANIGQAGCGVIVVWTRRGGKR